MYGRIVKSEHILTKLRVVDYEYICDRIAKFHKKILFTTRVINIQRLATKYFSFHYSVTYCSQASGSDVVLTQWTLTHETPDFITPALWPADSPDLNPVDYQIWEKLQERVRTAARFVMSTSWSRCLIDQRVGTFPPVGHRWSGQVVVTTSSSLRSSTRWTFWTQTLGVLMSCHLQFCTDAHLTVNHACVYSGHLCFWVTSLNLL